MIRKLIIDILDSSDQKIELTPSDLFANYFNDVVASVDLPGFRYEFDPIANVIRQLRTTSDSLSPPWFLESEGEMPDSMGAYRGEREPRDVRQYGEAVVEIRNIKNVSLKCLEDMRAKDKMQRDFLVQSLPDFDLLSQVKALFSFVSSVLK